MLDPSKGSSFSSDFFDFIRSDHEMIYNFGIKVPLYYKEFPKLEGIISPKIDEIILNVLSKNNIGRDIDKEISLKVFEKKFDNDFSFYDVMNIVDIYKFQYDSVVISTSNFIKILNKLRDTISIQLPIKEHIIRSGQSFNRDLNYESLSYCGKTFKVFSKISEDVALFVNGKIGSLYFKGPTVPLNPLTLNMDIPVFDGIDFLFNVRVNPHNYLIVEL